MGKKKIVKRNGDKMVFDKLKVKNAVLKAFTEIDGEINKYAKEKAADIANIVSKEVESSKRCLTVEQIQDIVVDLLMRSKRRDVAVAYIEYRYKRKLVRESNTTDETILNLIRGNDEYWKTENSNKNSNEVTVQRDYIAGATSTDISRRLLLPKDIVEAHDEGIIHFHDMDYYAQNVLSNCSLCNLEDMLQNGTVINDTMIEKPHRFVTAMTIATQIITAVTSSQYGGVSITLTHLAPFVRSSYDIRYKEYRNRGLSERKAKEFADKDIKKEIEDGVQTFNYQCNSMSTTNGQAPFLTVFMYLGETEEYKYELSLIIEEFLRQRIVGLKNEKGVYITPAFPKLIYVLEEDNIRDDSEYWYLTELSAKCTAKRMVPDYISEKKMKELKIDSTGRGNCYPCMGCVDGESVIDYVVNGTRYVETFEKAWERLMHNHDLKKQPNAIDMYMETPDVRIYDNVVGDYVKQYGIIMNIQSLWYTITLSNGRVIDVTDNHPFDTENRGVVLARDLVIGDKIVSNISSINDAPNGYVLDAPTEISSVEGICEYMEEKPSYDVTTESEHFMVNGIYSHNCRSFLTPYVDENGNPEYYGRFNIGVVTISLPDVALSSGGDMKKFWKIFGERTELCHKALRCRYERFINVTSDVAPIMWQNGALGRLKKGDHVTKLIDNQHATISLGYAGLYECVKYMTGSSHSSGEGKRFGIEIMKKLNEKTAQWRDAENLGYSLYGTPIESTTYKFAKCLKKRFGDDVFEKIDGKDRMYITNSYHVPVFEKIDPFDKLSIESKFQELSPGGAVSYIECADMQNNIPAVLSVMQFIYDNIMYAELNTKSDCCQKCGYDGEIKIIDEDGKLTWECPNCKNHDQNTMNVARRTCGYIGTNFWNPGRTEEISDRFEHLTDIDTTINE